MWRMNSGIFDDLVRLRGEMERLQRSAASTAGPRVYPPINIYDSPEGYRLRAELPGIDTASLDITVTRNEVVIAGERILPELGEGSHYHRRERDHGKFSRAFAMPDNIDSSAVLAKYNDGVLDLLLPRLPEDQPRKVAISTT